MSEWKPYWQPISEIEKTATEGQVALVRSGVAVGEAELTECGEAGLKWVWASCLMGDAIPEPIDPQPTDFMHLPPVNFRPRNKDGMEEREALLFSDGSLTVFNKDHTMWMIHQERRDADRNAPVDEWTKIVRIQFEVAEVLDDPAAKVKTVGVDVVKALADLLPFIHSGSNAASPEVAAWFKEHAEAIRLSVERNAREHYLAVPPDATKKSRKPTP